MYNTYEDIRKEYERIRLDSLLSYDEKKDALYNKYPKLKELDLKMTSIKLDIGRAVLDKTSIKELEENLKIISEERSNFLRDNNIPDDYKEIPCNCKKCKDTGYVNGKKCSCFIKKEIELFNNISHFENYIKDDNFDNLDLSYYNQSDVKIGGDLPYQKYMSNFIENIKRGIKCIDDLPYNSIFMGATGTGKTFLARCAGAEAVKLNKSVLYLNINEYLDSLKPDYEGEPMKQYATSCDLFIIDDLGTEKTTEFSNAEINYIIDKRLNDKKSTIITTNLKTDDIENRYLGPTYSRLMHMYTKCYLFGEDLRGMKNANI